MVGLPSPVTREDAYLAAIHDRLGEILDRLDGRREPADVPPARPVPAARQSAAAKPAVKRTRTRAPRTT